VDVDPKKTKVGKKIVKKIETVEVTGDMLRAMNPTQPIFPLLAKLILERKPMFYDQATIWWIWDKDASRWRYADDVDVLNLVHSEDPRQSNFTVNKKEKIITSLKMRSRNQRPKDIPLNWIQFKDQFFDVKTGQMFAATPEWFCMNPIPWSPGESEETPVMDALITSWVGEKYLPSIYEMFAYVAYRGYPIHLVFCFVGGGRNGKTTLQDMLQRFVGMENVCSSSFDGIIHNRFETFGLYKKLVCLLGETNFNAFDNTDTFKKLSGHDMMKFEAKNKDPIFDFSYAKVFINSNSLPSSNDTSDGFYRRWFIVDFPNEFPEGKNILDTIPEHEYENLARKIIRILPELLARGTFTNQGSIAERKQKYLEASNPLNIFLDEECERDPNGRVKYGELYNAYSRWLSARKRRVVQYKEFREALTQEGFDVDKVRIGDEVVRAVIGLRKREGLHKFSGGSTTSLDDGDNQKLVVGLGGGDGPAGDPASPHVMPPGLSSHGISIRSPPDILSFLRAQTHGRATFDEILNAVAPDVKMPDKWLMMNLRGFANQGDVFNPRPDEWSVLE